MKTIVDAIYDHGKLLLSHPLPLRKKTHVQVTIETSDIVELLTRLIPELNQNVHSPTDFYKKHVDLLQRIRESKRPLVLWGTNGPAALVLDPWSYVELEQRRQVLTDLLTRIPENPTLEQIWPAVGRRTFTSLKENNKRYERLKSKIERLRRQEGEIQCKWLDPLQKQRLEAEKELKEVEEQIANLTNQLEEK
jgi:predicted DNA-binding antitoxin AbrB/MazE fold protein